MLDRFRVKLLSMPRRWKRLLQVATDILLVWLSLWLAFVVRLGTDDMIDIFGEHAWLFIARHPTVHSLRHVSRGNALSR